MKTNYWYILVAVFLLPTTQAFAGPSEDLANILQHFQAQLGPVYTLVVALAYVLGVWFIADSIFKLKKYGQARTMMSTNMSMAKPLVLLGLGLSLLYFPTLIGTSISTFWLYGSSSVLKYPQEPSSWDAFVRPLIDTIRLFGLIAIIRGVVILTRLSHENPQPGTMGKGLMHIIAGTLAVNIVGTIQIVKATFGF
jgi:intracellular multiplication protein IcmC